MGIAWEQGMSEGPGWALCGHVHDGLVSAVGRGGSDVRLDGERDVEGDVGRFGRDRGTLDSLSMTGPAPMQVYERQVLNCPPSRCE